MSELFNIPVTLSPRLAWMRRHCIVISNNGDVPKNAECEFTGERVYRFCAHEEGQRFPCPSGRVGFGDTEDDALVDLARKLNIRLWNGA